MKNLLLASILLLLLVSSCTTLQPKYTTLYNEDYNKRITVVHPIFQKKLSPIGIGITSGAAAIGGIIGYNSKLIVKNKIEDQIESNKGASATIGAIIGYGLTSLGNNIIGKKGKTETLSYENGGPERWTRKFNKNYIFIDENSYGIIIIDKRAEKNYIVKNFKDVQQFNFAFPDSDLFENILTQSISVVSRDNIPKIIELYPQSNQINLLKEKFIDKSKTLDDYCKAIHQYPNIKSNPEISGFERIRNMEDVKLFISKFSNFDKNDLIDIAKSYANNFKNIVYFNKTFPNNKYQTETLLSMKKDYSSNELETLLKQFPSSKAYRELCFAFLEKSIGIDDFLNRNNKYSIIPMKSTINTLAELKKFVSKINTQKSNLENNFIQEITNEAKQNILKKIYKKVGSSDQDQNQFKRLMKKNTWLGDFASQYIKKAEHQVYLNHKAEIDRENEVDNIYSYIEMNDGFIETVEGNDLTFWESIMSTLADMGNQNAFISGTLVNYGKKPKRFKLIAKLNMFTAKQSMWGSSKDEFQKSGVFYAELNPGQSKDFVIMIPFKWKHKDEQAGIWGRNYFEQNIDKDNPVETELEYYNEEISADIIKKQDDLIRLYKQNGNVATKKGWESSYQVSSNGYKIISQSRSTNISVTELTANSTQKGCIHIYSNNDDDYGYSSKVFDRNGYERATFSDAMDDNYIDCYNSDDFPLTIKVSYISDDKNQISATIKLINYHDYDITITD